MLSTLADPQWQKNLEEMQYRHKLILSIKKQENEDCSFQGWMRSSSYLLHLHVLLTFRTHLTYSTQFHQKYEHQYIHRTIESVQVYRQVGTCIPI